MYCGCCTSCEAGLSLCDCGNTSSECSSAISSATPLVVGSGSKITLAPLLGLLPGDVDEEHTCENPLPAMQAGFSSTHSFKMLYNDQFGYSKEATITCTGYPSK